MDEVGWWKNRSKISWHRILKLQSLGKNVKELYLPEPGALFFEIAQSLFALVRTLILGAMALNKKKSDERTDKIQILSGSLMSDIRTKERSKNSWKTHENAQFIHILI